MSTLRDIVDRFRRETRDFPRVCSAESVGDGVSLFFQIPDYPIVEGSMVAKLQTDTDTPVEETDFDLDHESGQFWLTGDWQTTPPAENQKLLWSWQWTHWSDAELIRYANAGVRWMGQEYEIEFEDEDLTTEFGTHEYVMPAGTKRIVRVDLRYDESHRWKTTNKWFTRMAGGVPRIVFQLEPGDQQMRVSTISRPVPFVETEYEAGSEPEGWPGLLDQDLANTGLPEEALEPLIWYVIWTAYESRLIHRSRDDAAQHTKDETTVTMRDLETHAGRLKTIFDLHYGQFHTEFIAGRIIP